MSLFRNFLWFLLVIGISQIATGSAPEKQNKPNGGEKASTHSGNQTMDSRHRGNTFGDDERHRAQSQEESSTDETNDENTCSTGESHVWLDSATSCCNHTIILNHGLDLGKYWKECAVGLRSPKSKTEIANETYVNSTRRVYACVLAKHLRKQSVNLLSFAVVMTSKYPASIKDNILKLAKAQSKGEKPVSDYNVLREIRNAYMNIQKTVCMSMDTGRNSEKSDTTRRKPTKTSSTTRCDSSEEVELNGGACCQGESVPLDLDFWHPPPANEIPCNETLGGVLNKWSISKSDMDSALEICNQACVWKQRGVITSRALETVKMGNENDVVAQMRKIAPSYLSGHMLNVVMNYTRLHNQSAGFEKEIMKRYHLSDSTIITLRPCIGYWRLSTILYDALYEYCNPPNLEDNRRIQTKRSLSGDDAYEYY